MFLSIGMMRVDEGDFLCGIAEFWDGIADWLTRPEFVQMAWRKTRREADGIHCLARPRRIERMD